MGRGQAAGVPIDLQVELLDRVVRYERGFAGSREPVSLWVLRAGDAVARRSSTQLLARLRRTTSLGGRPVSVREADYAGAAALAAQCRAEFVQVLYLADGLSGEVPAITRSLSGAQVLTVAAVGSDVDRGAVLGFELNASRPRIVVNLRSARSQRQQFHAQFLRLARVIP